MILKTKVLNIVGIYLPPSTERLHMISILSDVLSQLDHSMASIILGDFNCRIDVTPLPLKTVDLLELLASFGFMLANESQLYTYVCYNGKSTIDLLFYSPPKCEVTQQDLAWCLLPSIRKHLPICTKISITSDLTIVPKIPPARLPRTINLELMQTLSLHIFDSALYMETLTLHYPVSIRL